MRYHTPKNLTEPPTRYEQHREPQPAIDSGMLADDLDGDGFYTNIHDDSFLSERAMLAACNRERRASSGDAWGD